MMKPIIGATAVFVSRRRARARHRTICAPNCMDQLSQSMLPGSPVSPVPAPDASTARGQGAWLGDNQPVPPPSTSTYMEVQTDTRTQTRSTLPGSPVSPVPAPDATTAVAQDRQNNDMAIAEHYDGGPG